MKQNDNKRQQFITLWFKSSGLKEQPGGSTSTAGMSDGLTFCKFKCSCHVSNMEVKEMQPNDFVVITRGSILMSRPGSF